MGASEYFSMFLASRITKASIQSGALRPLACFTNFDRYFGVRQSLSA